MRNAQGIIEGVFWATGFQRQMVQHYGQAMWVDGKWGGNNHLRWPYMAMGIVDEEFKVRPGAFALVNGETSAAYRYKCFLFKKQHQCTLSHAHLLCAALLGLSFEALWNVCPASSQ